MKNFWFSYQNILRNEILKKNYFSFFRKIFGILYKFLIKYLKHTFLLNVKNLDQSEIKNFSKKLDEIFIYFNCDKGSHCYFGEKKIKSHNYSIFYEKYFKDYKNKKINLLELGSHEGKGLASFFYYFPNSKLIGANINPFQMRFTSKRITELFVDVSSPQILTSLSHYLKEDQDIIIDDASHNLRDMLITFSIFFKKLKSNGVYVIEDMNQFEVYKELNPYQNELTVIEILKKIQNNEDFNSSFIDNVSKDYLINNISEIKIEKGFMVINNQNVSDIAFIYKK
tara:strand:+ start:401 stop:1249 length:849 start_codon:yes stop_codon:yes gene_type:complete